MSRPRHRLLRSRAQMRADIVRLEAEAHGLVCKLVIAAGEVDRANRERDVFRSCAEAATRRIAELEEAVKRRALAANPAPDAADLAIGRALEDTRELPILAAADPGDAPMVNTTSGAWKATTAHRTPVAGSQRPAPRPATDPAALPGRSVTVTVITAPAPAGPLHRP